MKRVGFEKARARLRDAFRAHEDLRSAADWLAFESAWTRLLTALNSVYTILEQSARGNPKSEKWFATAKKQRKADEALKYLHHARNVNEHGIVDIVMRAPGAIGIGSPGQSFYIEKLVIGPQGISEFRGQSLDGTPIQITHYPEQIVLVPVTDRGVDYNVPATFLGDVLDDATPLGLASKVLEFMVVLFSDAETLMV